MTRWGQRAAPDVACHGDRTTTIPLKTRILIADDHPIVLRGLRIVLDAQPDLEVTAEASDGEEAVKQALTEDVHLAILDISMPSKSGPHAAREITRGRRSRSAQRCRASRHPG